MTMDKTFKPTHRVYFRTDEGFADPIEVMLIDDIAYDQDEWATESPADFERVDGEWRFQGQPFTGHVEECFEDWRGRKIKK